jgi:redox-sensitive bicupin YhaK (pirin superfamily)
VTGLEQAVVVEPHDGSLGPLLRVADDRLAPGAAYGSHEHRAVDVVAVVLAGALTHVWAGGMALRPGDIGVLRAGTGLRHDERAGPDGARVLQCYLRTAAADAPASYDVVHGADGWVDLDRADARLWIGRGDVDAPAGLVLQVDRDGLRVARRPSDGAATGEVAVVVWQADPARPAWAD